MEKVDPALLLLVFGIAALAVLVNRRMRFIATITVIVLPAVAAVQVFYNLSTPTTEGNVSKSPRR
jgi:hypothetical protein